MGLSRLKEDINCVFERDPAARNVFEVLTTYPGLHAIIFYRLTNKLWHLNLKWLARAISGFGRWFTGIEIHPGATIGRRFFIDHGMGVVIGETAIIGDECTLYHGVTLGGVSWNKGKRHPTLENGVVVGAGAKVLGPIVLKDGCRVGSNAVVTKDVPEGATVVGIPGRIVRKASSAQEEQRRKTAAKIGFEAYGMTPEMPDPIARSIHSLLDHVEAVDQKIEGMCKALKELGSDYCDEALPQINDDDFAALSNGQKRQDSSETSVPSAALAVSESNSTENESLDSPKVFNVEADPQQAAKNNPKSNDNSDG